MNGENLLVQDKHASDSLFFKQRSADGSKSINSMMVEQTPVAGAGVIDFATQVREAANSGLKGQRPSADSLATDESLR